MKHHPLKLFYILFVLFFHTAWGTVLLEVSPNNASMNDNISLTFTYTGQQPARPNFDLLSKEFIITRSSQSNQISVFNGVVERQNKWRLLLTPKHAGNLTIPEINFANEKSPSKIIHIRKNSHKPPTENDAPIFMTASTTSKTPYVQQQFIYTINLFYRVNPLANETIPPRVTNAVLTPIGEGDNYATEIKGIPYHVLEQHFAAFAEKPGPITIASPIMNATLRRNNIHNISQLMDDMNDVVRISAPDITLQIQAIPASFKGDTWLPSRHVSLTDTWPDKKAALKAGDPITREITLQAEGLMANQLPELQFENIPGANVYSEPSKQKETLSNGRTVATKTVKVTYIPTGSDHFEVPPINIDWWDLKTKKMATASIAKKVFSVESIAVNQPSSSEKKELISKKTNALHTTPQPLAKKKSVLPTKHPRYFNVLLPWLLIGILLICFFIYVRRNIKTPNAQKTRSNATSASSKQLQKHLKSACMKNQPQAASQCIIDIMKLKYPQTTIRSLLDIQEISNEAFSIELKKLQNALYGSSTKWQGSLLWQTFLDFQKTKIDRNKPTDTILPKFN